MTKTKQSRKPHLSAWGWIWRLIVSLAIPLGVGGLSALIAGDSMAKFGAFNQPPLSPPAWLFPVAWTILYILMGVACFLVWIHPTDKQITAKEKTIFFVVYGVQLFFNFFWSIFFFNLGWHWFAFVWLIALWAMVLGLIFWGWQKSPSRNVATFAISHLDDLRRLSQYHDCGFELSLSKFSI